jgi:hypothetical protein
MKEVTQHPLGGFEQRLLRELRQIVADGAASAPVGPEPALAGAGWTRRRWPLAFAAGLATAFAALLVSGSPFGGDEGGRAWAVTNNNNGTVSVEIDSLTDAAGLQRKLNEAGVPALVQYIPAGKTCAGGELLPRPGMVAVGQTSGNPSAPPPGAHTSEYGSSKAGPVTQTEGNPWGGPAQGEGKRGPSSDTPQQKLTVQQKADGGVEFTIYEQSHPSGTLVIRAQGLASDEAPPSQDAAGPGTISVSQVQGQAQPCEVVDSPAQ